MRRLERGVERARRARQNDLDRSRPHGAVVRRLRQINRGCRNRPNQASAGGQGEFFANVARRGIARAAARAAPTAPDFARVGFRDLDGPTARDRVRSRVPDADPEDLLLFDDLLGVADPEVAPPTIDPDARRRRLTALINAASLARTEPALFIIEDALWIDAVSESMLTDFFTVIPQTPSLVLITYRPEYQGALTRVTSAHTIALAPLSDPETTALVSQLLGPDPSVGGVATIIAAKAAGNPFFAEEIVRDLAQRGVLGGNRSAYESTADGAEVGVPADHRRTHRPA